MEGIGYLRDCFRRSRGMLRLVGGAFTVFLLLCAVGAASPTDDPVRDAQISTLLFSASFAAFFTLERTLTPALAALLSYAIFGWVIHGQLIHPEEQIMYVAGAFLVALWLGKQAHLGAILSYAGMLEAVFGLAQWFGWNPWHYRNPWELHKPTGSMGQETMLGALLVACLAPALFQRRYIPAFFITLCIIACHSSFALASAGAVILVWIASLSIAAAVWISVFGFSMLIAGYEMWPVQDWFDPNMRQFFWVIGFKKFLERPIFGFGPGSWLPNAPWLTLRLTHVHNEFIEFLTEYGLVGAALASWSGWDFVRKFEFTWERALCIGLLVDSFGNFPMHIAPLGTIFLTAWLLSVRPRPVVLSYGGHGGQH